MIREPAVAGAFYPADPGQIYHMLDRLVPIRSRQPALGLIVPHAGWIYSGRTCGEVISRVEIPDSVILLCPNHTGLTRTEAVASMMARGAYRLPEGEMAIDMELADAILARTAAAQPDEIAHRREHAIEVVLPFLLRANPRVRMVPMVMKSGTREDYADLARGMAEAIRAAGRPVPIVASSDMTHYESAEAAALKDRMALDRVEAMDPEGLLEVTRRERITMCGVVGAAVMLMAARSLGARQAHLIDYTHSGQVTGQSDRVVAYAGVIVT